MATKGALYHPVFAGHINAGTQEQLAAYRQQIDSLDQRIIELCQQRARVVEEVGNVKREAHLPVTGTAGDREGPRVVRCRQMPSAVSIKNC